jgi:glutamine synthetase
MARRSRRSIRAAACASARRPSTASTISIVTRRFWARSRGGEAAGRAVSAASKEYAPGQFEANLKHQSDVRLAADHAVFLKQIVKAAARAQGFEATFMAKPYPDRSGSGLHIHVSVLDAAGRNIFNDGSWGGSDKLRTPSAACRR